jgi:hypothetical protein
MWNDDEINTIRRFFGIFNPMPEIEVDSASMDEDGIAIVIGDFAIRKAEQMGAGKPLAVYTACDVDGVEFVRSVRMTDCLDGVMLEYYLQLKDQIDRILGDEQYAKMVGE